MLAARSPQPAKAAAHAPQGDQDETALAKRFYRLIVSNATYSELCEGSGLDFLLSL
jgi:hypothetical protein